MNSTLTPIAFCAFLLTFYSTSLLAKTGGNCRYTDYQELAKVIDISNKTITLNTSEESKNPFKIELSKFEHSPNKNDFVMIHIRNHFSGGCNPFDIQRISQLKIANVNFNPEDGRYYQAAFAAAKLSGCSKQPQCAEKNSTINQLSDKALAKLQTLLPKTLKSCPIELLEKHLESIDKFNREQRIIGCANNQSKGKIMLEFIISKSKTNENPIELMRIY